MGGMGISEIILIWEISGLPNISPIVVPLAEHRDSSNYIILEVPDQKQGKSMLYTPCSNLSFGVLKEAEG